MIYAAGIQYAGSAYCGWQRQAHSPSVQQHVEEALGFVADHPLSLVCAGRTDAGVHAMEQVAHFESDAVREQRAWVLGGNCRLPRDIRLLWVRPVAADFHARYSAFARSYRYLVQNSEVPSAVFHDRFCWEFRRLDQAVMHECAQCLVGEHDFSSFRAAGCQSRSAMRNLQEISVARRGDMIWLDIRANAFLYHMVRNIAGSLLAVGRGERDIKWFAAMFAACDRGLAEPTAPAGGLYFVRPWYDPRFELPAEAKKPVLF